MKTNRQINECHCDNCRKYEECRAKGVFDDDPGFDFCVNAIVPQVALQIFKTIEEYEKQ